MTRLLESKKVCATMFLLFALSVLANTFAGGSQPSFGASPLLVPGVQLEQLADSPFPWPDPLAPLGSGEEA
jgi:hypothetical protein